MDFCYPTKDEFCRLAEKGNLIPVTRRLLADQETPLTAYRKIRGQGESFLFESVEGGEHLGRYSFVGCNPRGMIRQFGDKIEWIEGGAVREEFKVVGRGNVHNKFGVEDGRINVWVPLTPVWGDNSLWIESKVGSGQYEAVNMKPGQLLIFDGVNLRHGSRINSTSATRVSFDLRFLPGKGPAVPTSY